MLGTLGLSGLLVGPSIPSIPAQSTRWIAYSGHNLGNLDPERFRSPRIA
jgi:hypothetical protein